jgi:putative nucleotidyltransferase with HDIG domain
LLVVDRVARRLLPLAVLLRMTLVFPDRAPSRLAVALSASSRSRLSTYLAAVEDPQHASNVEALVTLAAALNSHDRRTRGHSERVRALTDLLAQELRLPEADADRLRWAAFLHDIGKLRVPAQVLNKRGPLTSREWNLIGRHPGEGSAMAAPLRPWLGEWIDAIDQHHERYDGGGYPHGFQHRRISLAARIVAVADSFETMTAVRSYNKPKTVIEARRELVRCAGTHFDPQIVRRFLAVSVGHLRWTVGIAAWIAELPIIGIPTRAGAEVVTAAAGVESTTSAIIGAAALTIAGVATPAIPVLTTTAVLAENKADAPTRRGQTEPGAATADQIGSHTSNPSNPDSQQSPGTDAGTTTPSSDSPAPDAPGSNPGSPGGTPTLKLPGTPEFVPPGHGGIPPGLTRITPGRDNATPPGQGGTPPGHTGVKP